MYTRYKIRIQLVYFAQTSYTSARTYIYIYLRIQFRTVHFRFFPIFISYLFVTTLIRSIFPRHLSKNTIMRHIDGKWWKAAAAEVATMWMAQIMSTFFRRILLRIVAGLEDKAPHPSSQIPGSSFASFFPFYSEGPANGWWLSSAKRINVDFPRV